MVNGFDLTQLLPYISADDYETWTQVGMALKHEGYPVSVWESWSQTSPKYVEGECAPKWNSFNEQTAEIVTGASITAMAKAGGWTPRGSGKVYGWNDRLTDEDIRILSPDFHSNEKFEEPETWDPVTDCAEFLRAVFEPSDTIMVCFDAFEREDGKWSPAGNGTNWNVGELIDRLKRFKKLDDAFSKTPNQAAGAWIRVNPMDGQGGRNNNVADYRYALVESDNMPIPDQIAKIKGLELPVAALTYSGGKSVHALVHIDAVSSREYTQRVQRLYEVCEKNGLSLDTQNKNSSRFSRLPGVMRNGHKQFLIGTKLGHKDFVSWTDWLDEQQDDLPEIISFPSVRPPLSPEMIHGILRVGHKLMLSGPSKSGKSFSMIEACIALAVGGEWFGWKCEPCDMLYVNLEIDGNSFINRIHDVIDALGLPHELPRLKILNLRGKSAPLDILGKKIIRAARNENFGGIILDPIYKMLMGDENSASDMAAFTNQMDYIATSLHTSLLYAHHQTKGAAGSKKVIDRFAGSGVFARDADALLTMSPLTEGEGTKNAFRIEGILREFAAPKPVNVWWEHPLHRLDTSGLLSSATVEGSPEEGAKKTNEERSEAAEIRRDAIAEMVASSLKNGEKITLQIIADTFGCSKKTAGRDLKEINKKYSLSYECSRVDGEIFIKR